jgi:hypothetical protein
LSRVTQLKGCMLGTGVIKGLFRSFNLGKFAILVSLHILRGDGEALCIFTRLRLLISQRYKNGKARDAKGFFILVNGNDR